MTKFNSYLKTYSLSFLTVSCLLSLVTIPVATASDHVDSPIVTLNPGFSTGVNANGKFTTIAPSITPKGKPEDITDIYIFREGDQTGNAADNANLVLIMTSNGLTAPGQSNQFGTDIDYVFKIATDKSNLTANQKNISVRFGKANQAGQQRIWVNGINAGLTTTFNAATPVVNIISFDQTANSKVKVFAGEMEDPFFLDFRVITEGLGAGVNGAGSIDMTRQPSDTFANSNVNSIVLSVPITWLQQGIIPTPNTFYIWGVTNK